MTKIVYYVATSLDGYIAGEGNDISLFVFQGKGVDQYQADLKQYTTVIMGRSTYEFGYDFGLKPGQPAYPHMEHYIFSETLSFEEPTHPQVHVESASVARIQEIKAEAETDIYLCGGGAFAGWLLDHHLIDVLKIKLNPIVLGSGVRLFGSSATKGKWHLTDQSTYEDGLLILTYEREAASESSL